jgi:4-oxalocrotonate tautomerase
VPLVQVSMAEGRTDEQKRALLQAITQAVHESLGAPVASIRVWIHEFGPHEFIAGGEIYADRQARLAAERQAGGEAGEAGEAGEPGEAGGPST